MLSMVILIPAAFGLLVWSSYRSHRRSGGEAYEPEGKLRWEEARR